MKEIKVAELFAGVGGFRLGLEGYRGKSSTSSYEEDFASPYKVVWSNQWEPATKIQHASKIYELRFGSESHSNEDIALVKTDDIPDHDLLVGGFPCQDYSVARQLSQAAGIDGKKGVLWWQIHRILVEKGDRKPNYLFLENVDRLINSPAKQRGRDFAIILASLSDLGYIVEWRVINAAEYGMPQRRRRTFIMAYHKNSPVAKNIKDPLAWITSDGTIARAFEVEIKSNDFIFPLEINGDLVSLTENFNKGKNAASPFQNTGIMIDREVWTLKTKPNYEHRTVLNDILQPLSEVPKEYFIDADSLDKWKYLKGAKKEPRKKSNGETFYYVEGPLPFPDPLDRPARTIITAEGGKTPSRFKHVVLQDGQLRRLTPIELERANMFPDNHTLEANDTKRAFFMGNALVVGVIELIGKQLCELIQKEIRLLELTEERVQ